MARPRLYPSDAARQAAYRHRLADRLELAGTAQAAQRIATLEAALVDAQRRTTRAEERAARAERRAAGARDRYLELLVTRPDRHHSAPLWAAQRLDDHPVTIVLQRVAHLEATVIELRARLADTQTATPAMTGAIPEGGSRPNRADRRAAQRNQRRR